MSASSALIAVMDKACRKVAGQLRRDFGEVSALQVSRKGPADYVSQADLRTEEILREELTRARPRFGWLMEENGAQAGEEGEPRWIVDPIDGTTNFLHAIPHFAVSIAVEHQGEIIAAFTYQPITDETYWAEKGKGAWLGRNRLRVSARRELSEAVMATGIPYLGHGDSARFSRILASVMPRVAGVRRFGAASLDLAWVAAGRFDGFWEEGLSPWDVAAGVLLVREAGGFVSDFRGGESMLSGGSIIAGNTHLHSQLHKLVAQGIKAVG